MLYPFHLQWANKLSKLSQSIIQSRSPRKLIKRTSADMKLSNYTKPKQLLKHEKTIVKFLSACYKRSNLLKYSSKFLAHIKGNICVIQAHQQMLKIMHKVIGVLITKNFSLPGNNEKHFMSSEAL